MPKVTDRKALWLRLRGYQFDDVVPKHLSDHVRALFGHNDASTQAFASKIARKHRWTHRFAMRAVNEYRKYVYLGVTGDEMVTPSKVIDTVWHEHLLFTRAYREFCATVVQQDFDHHPELVPVDAQTAVFERQYEETLKRYYQEFHVMPPADIWGTTKFSPDRRSAPYALWTASDSGGGDMPLYAMFDSSDGSSSHADMAEFSFGGGGGFSGGGGGSDWGGDDNSDSDSGSGDSSGGDSGGGDGGGSGCSSGCGGGGD